MKQNEGTLRYGTEGTFIYNGTFDQNEFHGKGEHSTPHSYYKG